MTDFEAHVGCGMECHVVVQLPDIQFRCTYPPIMRLVRDLSDAQRDHIGSCGFGYLLQMTDIHVNHGLLTVLVEQFHSEHNTFHLSTGEMTITLEDVYNIMRIPFVGDKVDYDATPRQGIEALRRIFQDGTILNRDITWDDLLSRYGAQFPLACVLASIIGCFVMSDRGQQGFLCGWGRMLERLLIHPVRLGWGSGLLVNIYHEMHGITYRGAKSMATSVLVLYIWVWEHILVCRPIVDDSRQDG
ncbi:protein MAIN-LIKE 1-like [Cryptomeria japonica]|uniref:protein MAIN-LIKE 1-like n=1 Tax=Cryptomeria japonica TaxID=3369 RepID=UPI0025ABAFC8|nr:protein MAIN-LIKE 1-like [Cryptomeria japonica]